MPRSEQPLEGDDPLTAFAADLRVLRRKAGSPPYRKLARDAHYASTTLADAAGGRRLPTLAVALAYVRACGGDAEQWEARWHEVSAALAHQAPDGAETKMSDGRECPYVGLSAFDVGDAGHFFGRERLTEELVARVRSRRFTAVFGASGSGKSSLLRAGLLPRLSRTAGGAGTNSSGNAAVADDTWPVLFFTPGAHPLDECAVRLAALTGGSTPQLHEQLRQDSRTLYLVALQLLLERPAAVDLLVVVDQFEEVFTLCPQEERAQFLDLLLTAVDEANSRVRVVLGVRADFYPRCAQYPQLVEALRDAQVLVGPMNTEELRRAISGPAAGAECTVEGALLARIVADAAGQPNALPLVSHALRETWRYRRGNTLAVSGYEAAGGMHHALARTAEAAYQALSGEQQRVARGILLRLVALGEGTQDIKRPAARDEFDIPQADAVLDALASARLITLDAGSVELTHEALLNAWPRLHRWIDEDRAKLLTRQQLVEAAAAWQRERRDTGSLYRGERLAAATAWAEGRHDLPLDERSRQFLAVSTRHARRSARLRRGAIAALCALTLLASGTAVTAVRNARQARAQSAIALSHQLVAQSNARAADNPMLAEQLALTAWTVSPTEQAAAAMSRLLSADWHAGMIAASASTFNAVAFSPDGRKLAGGASDGTVRVWDSATRQQLGEPVHNATPVHDGSGWGTYALAFSPDSRVLAVGGDDDRVRLWDLTTRRSLGQVRTALGPRASLAFSPDGRTLAVIKGSGFPPLLWDRASGRTKTLTTPHREAFGSMAFSPDGKLLATGATDKAVWLWDPSTGRPLRQLIKPPAHVYVTAPPLAFSRDSKTLAIGGQGGTVQVRDVSTGDQLGGIIENDPGPPRITGVPASAKQGVYALAFSLDDRHLTTFADDAMIRTWDLATRQELGTPTNIGGNPVNSTAFSPDAGILALGAYGTVRLWDTVTGTPLGAPVPAGTDPANPAVTALAFSPNDRILATGGYDGSVRLWNPATRHLMSGPLHEVTPDAVTILIGVSSLAFSPDSKILAVGTGDGMVHLRNAVTGALIRSLGPVDAPAAGHAKPEISSLAYSPDGKNLAAAVASGGVYSWDPASTKIPSKPLAHIEATGTPVIAFSTDGRALAVGGDDGRLRLWDPKTGHAVSRPIQADTLSLSAIAKSSAVPNPSSEVFTLRTNDGKQRVWDLSTGILITPPKVNPLPDSSLGGGTTAMAFSPDGKTLALGAGDQTVTLWDPAANRALAGPIQNSTYRYPGDGEVAVVAFSPDGKTLATVASSAHEGILNIWPFKPFTDTYAVLCANVGALSRQDWNTYAPGEPQPNTCSSER